MIPQSKIPRARGLRADIANLLFEPKEIAVMTIPTATAPAFITRSCPRLARRSTA